MMIRKVAFLLVFVLFCTGTPRAVDAEPLLLPGAGIDVLHYAADVTPDFAEKSIVVTEKIRFRSTGDAVSRISFSPNSLTIDHATLNGVAATAHLSKNALTFHLPKAVRKGAVATLVVAYHGSPARGLVWSATGNWVYSDYFACDWLICLQDAPGDKATASITLDLPRGMRSVSIGTEKPISVMTNNRERHIWKSRRGYSAYLIGFAAGQFEETRDGKRLRYLSNVRDVAMFEKLFGTSDEMLAFFEARAGIRLPPRRYTQVLIEGSAAQEAATHATIGHKELDPILADPAEDWVIAHEMAHQWWGNLVTCKSWKDFWLNEGITTFMTAAWKEHKHGRAAYEAELGLARKRLARAAALGFDMPLAFAGDYPSTGVRRAVQYSKGALFMDHLRTVLGEEHFWAGLRRFTRQHAGGAVESKDFQNAFEQSAKQDLSSEFNKWVYP
jgi:aminopeptidase N